MPAAAKTRRAQVMQIKHIRGMRACSSRRGPDIGLCAGLGVPALNPASVSLLAEHGIDIQPLEPLGAEVTGLDLRRMTADSQHRHLVAVLTKEMAGRGYLVFRGQVFMCAALILQR